MAVKITSPLFHDIKGTLEVDGKTVGECLAALVKQYASTREVIFDQQGRVNNYLYFFLNDVDITTDIREQLVKDGDEIIITAILEGG